MNQSMVEQIFWVWSRTAPPIRPSPEGLEVYRSLIRGSDSVMVFGATPELIDLAIEEGVRRITSLEMQPEVAAAMRRLGAYDWDDVEFLHSNWLDYRADLESGFDTVVCDGGLLFLEFPDQWRGFFENAGRYLRPNGRMANETYHVPPGSPTYEDGKRECLARFDRARGDQPEDVQVDLFRALSSEAWAACLFGAVRANGSFDHALVSARLDETADELANRYPAAMFQDTIEANLRVLARSRVDQLELRTFAGPELGRPLLEACGFDVEVVPLPDGPVAGADYVYVANKR